MSYKLEILFDLLFEEGTIAPDKWGLKWRGLSSQFIVNNGVFLGSERQNDKSLPQDCYLFLRGKGGTKWLIWVES